MKRKLATSMVIALAATLLAAAPSQAEIGTEDPLDPCFSAASGYFDRWNTSQTSTSDFNSVWGSASNSEIAQTGQLFRGDYSYYSNTAQSSTITRTSYVSYDSQSNSKTVISQAFINEYFMNYVFVNFAGYLIGDNGEELASTSWTSRSYSGGGGGGELSLGLDRTQTIHRNCDGSQLSQASGFYPGQVFEFPITVDYTGTVSLPAFSGIGSQSISIAIEAGTVAASSKLSVVNDPLSTDNKFGLASIGLKLTDEAGNQVKMLKPLTVSFQNVDGAMLAASSDGGNWSLLSTSAESKSGWKMAQLTPSSFSISDMGTNDWVFVGQKIEQSSPIVYANRFSAPVGSTILITTTSGSGRGGVELKTKTPETCAVAGSEVVSALKPGVCKVSAVKAGFDGYMHAKTQVIRLEIGD